MYPKVLFRYVLVFLTGFCSGVNPRWFLRMSFKKRYNYILISFCVHDGFSISLCIRECFTYDYMLSIIVG